MEPEGKRTRIEKVTKTVDGKESLNEVSSVGSGRDRLYDP